LKDNSGDYAEAADSTGQMTLSQQIDDNAVQDANKCFDAVEAKDWQNAWTPCLSAAERGDASAQNNVGYMYDNGFGTPKDAAKAVIWYRKAADQGEVTAQNNLAASYDFGTGVSQDRDEAVVWYEKAAAQGNADAKRRLSEIISENNKTKIVESWIGRYKGILFGDAAATMHVTKKGNSLNFDLFMEGEYCGGGFEQTAMPRSTESVVVTMPYDADSGLQCKVQINQKSFGLELKELSACHMHHGFRCGFAGSLFRE